MEQLTPHIHEAAREFSLSSDYPFFSFYFILFVSFAFVFILFYLFPCIIIRICNIILTGTFSTFYLFMSLDILSFYEYWAQNWTPDFLLIHLVELFFTWILINVLIQLYALLLCMYDILWPCELIWSAWMDLSIYHSFFFLVWHCLSWMLFSRICSHSFWHCMFTCLHDYDWDIFSF